MTATLYALIATAQLSLFTPPPAIAPAPSDSPPSETQAAATDPQQQAYQTLKQLLAQGITAGDEHPANAVLLLEAALDKLVDFAPQLAADPVALEMRANAHVSLARAHLVLGHELTATTTMDEGIRSTLGGALPAEHYGPTIEKLWRERSTYADAHPGQPVVVTCRVMCRVYINERRVGPEDLRGLSAGTYRLWVEGAEVEMEVLRAEIEVSEGDGVLTIRYPSPREGVIQPVADVPEGPAHTIVAELNARDRRIMKGGVIAMGVGGSVIGAGLIAGFVVWGAASGGGYEIGATIGVIAGVGGSVCLIIAGITYAKAKGRLAKRTKTTRLRLAPTFAGSAEGASFGVSLRF